MKVSRVALKDFAAAAVLGPLCHASSAVATAGCGTSLGAALVTDTLPHSTTTAGPTAAFRTQPNGSEGLVIGGSAIALPHGKGGSHGWQGWADLSAGYGVVPLAHASRVGFEAMAGPAAGVLARDERHPFAAGWSFRLAVPVRVSRSRASWQVDSAYEPIGCVVPEVSLAQMFPLDAGVDHHVANYLGFSLSFRYDRWLTVVP
jgi:hypothetical protein